MLCPVCQTDNFEGDDNCSNCGADLASTDTPRQVLDSKDTILGDHLDTLGIDAFTAVPSSMAVDDAIRAMHERATDCLLVVDDEHLVGIFTDRDAVVKAADKRLQLYRVEDFMTADPVVLRHDDTLAVAIHKMAVGGFRHIPIVEAGKPVGVVTAADIFRHLVAGLG
jgi:signal-transduction protein with cAMP-binding, CBS, and nucleotidyltransferase domain